MNREDAVLLCWAHAPRLFTSPPSLAHLILSHACINLLYVVFISWFMAGTIPSKAEIGLRPSVRPSVRSDVRIISFAVEACGLIH